MNVKIIDIKGTWRSVADAARTTINMEEGEKEPSSHWKKNMLLAEHSPIRKIHINWKWFNLKYWTSVHFVRHKIGIEHWVSTQRDDRQTYTINQEHKTRDNAPQNIPVTHECEADAQAIINISRKRLCKCASEETREAWKEVLNNIKDKQPELFSICVPECCYRGFCPELKSCGYYRTDEYKERLKKYRSGINE